MVLIYCGNTPIIIPEEETVNATVDTNGMIALGLTFLIVLVAICIICYYMD